MNKTDEIKTFIKEETIDIAFISESHDRESKRLEDHFVLENFQVISNVYQRQGKGGRPAIIVNNEKYEIQDITNTLVQIPWGVEVTWAVGYTYAKKCHERKQNKKHCPWVHIFKTKFKKESSNSRPHS